MNIDHLESILAPIPLVSSTTRAHLLKLDHVESGRVPLM